MELGTIDSMRAQVFWRKVHYWMSIVVALPLLIVIGSGLLLQLKKDVSWIQPHEHRGQGGPPQLSFDRILAECALLPHVGVQSWDDVHRLDYRPDKGLLKVTTHGGWEVQIDPSDGRVLQVAVRRSDWIESFHDGSWFGAVVKRWVFLPSGVMLAMLWGTGIYLFFLPQMRRKRAAVASRTELKDRP